MYVYISFVITTFYTDWSWPFQNILRDSNVDVRLQKKALILLADLAQCQLENAHRTELPFLSDRDLLKSVVDLIAASTDLDLQDKVLCWHGIWYY